MARSFADSMKLWNQLFNLISVEEENEEETLELLEKATAEIINTPSPARSGGETMLMWAVWRLKLNVVKKLLEKGADPLFFNEMGQSTATYWNKDTIKEKEDVACEIAKILFAKGVRLSVGVPGYSYSLVKIAKVGGFSKLGACLEELYKS